MIYLRKPEDQAGEMRGLAEVLRDFTPPRHPPDADISWMKQREVVIDGYRMVAHFSQADYGEIVSSVLTIACVRAPFVPFVAVCKAVGLFFDHPATLYEYTRSGRKIYSWMSVAKQGRLVDNPHQGDAEDYHGFTFYRAASGQSVNAD